MSNRDILDQNRKPLSLNFEAGYTYLSGKKPKHTDEQRKLISKSGQLVFQINRPKNLDFDFLTVVTNSDIINKPIKSSDSRIDAYYFPYKTLSGGDSVSTKQDCTKSIGNVVIPKRPGRNDPEYCITGEMQGCELYVTKEGSNHLRVWHFPSPNSNKVKLNQFLNLYKNDIVGHLKQSDYGKITRNSPSIEGFNYLHYNKDEKSWKMKAIPLERHGIDPRHMNGISALQSGRNQTGVWAAPIITSSNDVPRKIISLKERNNIAISTSSRSQYPTLSGSNSTRSKEKRSINHTSKSKKISSK